MTFNYTIKTIPKTEEGVAFYLSYYKPFRLRALKTDPSAFSSTYAQEATFDDDKWRSRILSPIATTLVAVADADAEPIDRAASSDDDAGDRGNKSTNPPTILSITTVIGPIPAPPELVKYINNKVVDHFKATEDPLVWEVNAVWTAPEARRRGIARRLLREAIRLVRAHQGQIAASSQAASSGASGGDGITREIRASLKQLMYLTIGVDKNNPTALALYTKSGYVPFSEVKEGEREYTYLYLPLEDMSSSS